MPASNPSAYSDALDEARTRDDDVPGEEVGLVDPADFGLTMIDDSDPYKVVVLCDDGEEAEIRWSSANYFWYVVE